MKCEKTAHMLMKIGNCLFLYFVNHFFNLLVLLTFQLPYRSPELNWYLWPNPIRQWKWGSFGKRNEITSAVQQSGHYLTPVSWQWWLGKWGGEERGVGKRQERMDLVAMVHARSYPLFCKFPFPFPFLDLCHQNWLRMSKETHSSSRAYEEVSKNYFYLTHICF